MVVNRNKRNKGNKSKGNKDFFGLLLIIVSTIFLLCLIVPFILSFISEGIRYVLLGLFGIFAYALFGGLLALGVCLFLNKKVRVNRLMIVLAAVDLFILLIILQLVTSTAYLSGSFGDYMGNVYNSQYTAGGAFLGIFAYSLAFAMTDIATYIVLGLGFAGITFFMGRKLYLKYAPAVVKKISDKSALSNDYSIDGEPTYDSFEPHYRQSRPARPANSLFCERIVTKESRNADFSAGNEQRPVPEQVTRKNEKPPREQQAVVDNSGRRMDAQEARGWLYDRDDDSVNRRNSDPNYREQLRNSLYVSEKKSESTAKQAPLKPIMQTDAPPTAEEYSIPKTSMPRKIVHENRVILPTPKQLPDDVPGEIVNSTNLFKEYPQPPIVRDYQQSEIKQQPAPIKKAPKDEPDELPPILSMSDLKKKPNNDAGFGFITNFEEEAQNKYASKLEDVQPKVIDEDDDFGIISSKSFEDYDDVKEGISPTDYNYIKKQLDDNNSSPIIRFDPYMADEDDYPHEPNYNAIKKQESVHNDSPIINASFLSKKADEVRETRKNDFVKPVAPVPEKPVQTNGIVSDSSFGLLYDDDDANDEIENVDGGNDDDFGVNDYEIISASNKSNKRDYGLVVDDKVIDKTESDYDFGSNDSGYYVKEDAAPPAEEAYKPRKVRSKNEPIGGQLTIDDTVSFVPKNVPIIKKAEPYHYNPPPLDLLLEPMPVNDADAEEIVNKRELIEATLSDLKYAAKVINVIKGPTVTRFELQPPTGMSVRKILGKDSDIEYALATKGVRIEAPIAGKQAIGIEVPNIIRDIVYLRELLDCPEFAQSDAALPLALGKDLGGSKIIKNLEKMPHLLVAGATGTGKSVCLNALILSLVYHCSPEDLRMILVDPKCVEFSAFRNLPHLLIPDPIIDPQHTINSFDWAIIEMNNRYQLFSAKSVRNIGEYNKTAEVKSGKIAKLPYIVIIVDELADLMLSRKREVEDRIRNITQKSRAAGIHLILATQRPSVDVITGTIKINLPCRVAFSVTSNPDSRTVLDQGGAESLIGNGDMLFMPQDSPDLKRLQGALVTNDEISSIVKHVIQSNKAIFDPDIGAAIYKSNEPVSETATAVIEEESGDDKILPNIMRTLITSKSASTSMIQRRFAFGYARASRIIDIIEQRGWIGKMEGSKPREVFMTVNQFEDIFGRPFNEEE